jgi:hypothetical protein
MNQLNQYTFGKTPAAEYLVRELNRINDPALTRSISTQLKNTRTLVTNLVDSYEDGILNPKTLANTLRLMRLEIINKLYWEEINCPSDHRLAHKLSSNVQIGAIKAAIRLSSVACKSARIVKKSWRQNIHPFNTLVSSEDIKIFDKQLGINIVIGVKYIDENGYNIVCNKTIYASEVETITPELLHQRSDARCLRLGKKHMKMK